MQAVTTIGLDIAKSVFQIHGVDAAGNVIVRRKFKRRYVLSFFQKLPPCLVGIEACASSHHWSRELQALGHTVRLMPPAYVRPYVKRQKTDAADAEAICEAVTRANMRFVATKTPEQQSCLMLHRTRHLFIRQQTAVINAIRAHLAELGIVAPVGRNGVEQLLDVVADASDKRLPEIARACLAALGVQLRALKLQIVNLTVRLWLGTDPMRRASGWIIWAEIFRLDWARAKATLERGQGQARQYQQTGRSLSAQLVHGGRAGRHPLCQDPWHQTSTLAYSIVGATAYQGRCDRARQQDRKNGVGHDGQR